jgi:hypothetical protein
MNPEMHKLFAKAGAGIKGDLIPGLRSLRSLTRGYYLSSLRDSLSQTSILNVCLRRFPVFR